MLRHRTECTLLVIHITLICHFGLHILAIRVCMLRWCLDTLGLRHRQKPDHRNVLGRKGVDPSVHYQHICSTAARTARR